MKTFELSSSILIGADFDREFEREFIIKFRLKLLSITELAIEKVKMLRK